MDFSPKMVQYVDSLTAPERSILSEIIHQADTIHDPIDRRRVQDALATLAVSYARTTYRRARGQARDAERRTLIGARLRRKDVDRYRALADQTGRSLYSFVRDALEAEAQRCDRRAAQQQPATKPAAQMTAQDIEWVPLVSTISCVRAAPSPGNPKR